MLHKILDRVTAFATRCYTKYNMYMPLQICPHQHVSITVAHCSVPS